MSVETYLAEQEAIIERLRAVARAARGYRSCVRACHDCCSWEGDCVDTLLAKLEPGDLGEA